MSDYPRDDLFRTVSLNTAGFEIRQDGDGDGRTMAGYPILFDTWTEINGWEGQFMERIAPGALNKTLADRGDQVKVLFNHGMDPTIGEKPLGRANVMRVDERGLYAEVPLARTSYNDDLLELMRTGVLDGMSFRFSVVKEEWDDIPERSKSNPDALPERTITELKLYEFGPVTFPAYAATSVGVRSQQAYELIRDRLTPQNVSEEVSDVDEPEAAQEGTSDESHDEPPAGALDAPALHERKVRAKRLASQLDTRAAIAIRNSQRGNS